ncbi:MAG: histidine triad nucleotide-binding protein [Nitrospirae bacterium]|nr:histidine triad nucleotide-binding protein [Nitrospirota bacterium]
MDCLFCKIANKQISSNIVYEDDEIAAFTDVSPKAPVHILIIPKKHIPTVLDLTVEDCALIGRLYMIANKIATDKKIDKSGFRLVMNCNRDAGQSVFHIHLHMLGGRVMSWPPG